MHCTSSVYCVITPIHVSGVSAAHHQEEEYVYVASGICYTSELTVSGHEVQLRSITNTICHKYTFDLLMMGC
jgi:hypothetical protein